MRNHPSPRRLALVGLGLSLIAGEAFAWGATGHRLIGREAMRALPADTPEFLRAPAGIEAVGELAREPDRSKDAGKAHDSDRDPGHFVDAGDDGAIFGGPTLAELPDTREHYETALRAVGADSWKAGYLPYSIMDSWQQLAKDFAYWRVDLAGAAHVANRQHRAWLAADLVARQALILRDAGALAHFVGDGSQPLHVSIHYNGWGPYPNPEGFTQDRLHGPFEGAFVHDVVRPDEVRTAMSPYVDCHCDIAKWTAAYLGSTAWQTPRLYELQKAGAFKSGDLRGRAFATERVAAGASALRDLVTDAWRASASGRVGYPALSVADVLAGRRDPYDSLYGLD